MTRQEQCFASLSLLLSCAFAVDVHSGTSEDSQKPDRIDIKSLKRPSVTALEAPYH